MEKIRKDEASRYPFLLIKEANGNPELVSLIKEASEKIYSSSFSGFSRLERKFYQDMRSANYSSALSAYKKAIAKPNDHGRLTVSSKDIHLILSGFGEKLIELIPQESRSRLFPFNDFKVDFQGKNLEITFSSLLAKKSSEGTIFYGPRKPQIKFEENHYTVGFSRHAIQRICERQNPRYMTYNGLGDAFVFFGSCLYYKPVYLFGGQPAFVVFNLCDNQGFIQYEYLKRVLGKENYKKEQGRCYYQVGYCPVVFHEGFAVAKTFLIPGYTGTPEYGLLINSDLPHHEKGRLLQMTHNATEDDVILKENWELIKWFHDNGIPQVVQLKEKVFESS